MLIRYVQRLLYDEMQKMALIQFNKSTCLSHTENERCSCFLVYVLLKLFVHNGFSPVVPQGRRKALISHMSLL